MLVVDGCQPDHANDVAFARDGTAGSSSTPSMKLRRPWLWSPAWTVPNSAAPGIHLPRRRPRQRSVNRSSAQFDAVRALLPPTFQDIVAIGLGNETPFGIIEQLAPRLAPLLLKAERTALSKSGANRGASCSMMPNSGALVTSFVTYAAVAAASVTPSSDAVTKLPAAFLTDPYVILFCTA